MSKKDYILIASLMKESRDRVTSQMTLLNSTTAHSILDEHKSICEDMATAFKADNPRFNTDRFLSACGIECGG